MSEVKHTPGPWEDHYNSWEYSSVYGPGQELVAECPIHGDVDDETQDLYEERKEANARLIAAAPDMLEALKAAVSALEWWEMEHRCCHGATDEQMTIIKAALAKAEGRS